MNRCKIAAHLLAAGADVEVVAYQVLAVWPCSPLHSVDAFGLVETNRPFLHLRVVACARCIARRLSAIRRRRSYS